MTSCDSGCAASLSESSLTIDSTPPSSMCFPCNLLSFDRLPTSVLVCSTQDSGDKDAHYFQVLVRSVAALIAFQHKKILDDHGMAFRIHDIAHAIALRLHYLGYGDQLGLATQAGYARVYAHARVLSRRTLRHCRDDLSWGMSINCQMKDDSVHVYRPLHVLALVARVDQGITADDISQEIAECDSVLLCNSLQAYLDALDLWTTPVPSPESVAIGQGIPRFSTSHKYLMPSPFLPDLTYTHGSIKVDGTV
ncbi:hypothetical protein BCR44DRAFT_263467 [Catenaria anguillulae PL171]|uniref:Uncharacterized protein n=1 Tax=Catenaria anguillulae PL171 TaxID=765915 RepID=A0A1Y2H561_9FUNG|nr:hypothetical protein BCR44DRAFT_263467 [Catenaria anguillulae PL171]